SPRNPGGIGFLACRHDHSLCSALSHLRIRSSCSLRMAYDPARLVAHLHGRHRASHSGIADLGISMFFYPPSASISVSLLGPVSPDHSKPHGNVLSHRHDRQRCPVYVSSAWPERPTPNGILYDDGLDGGGPNHINPGHSGDIWVGHL